MKPPLDRRAFLRTGASALGAAVIPPSFAPALSRLAGPSEVAAAGRGLRARPGRIAAVDVRIDVLTREAIAPVTPLHYGHFIEHLGGVIYDGVWVGERSKIANIGGIRKALVDDLRRLSPGIVRWPGGCFADSYDWMDGSGPREKRPRRTNFWAGELAASVTGASRYDPNHFGTPEFMRFCRLVGAEPYLAVNGRAQAGQQFAQWVEYCNAPAGATTLSDRRAADGSPEPYNVRYWGLGNEPWGCGGTLTPEEYAAEYRRLAAWVPTYPASGVGATENDTHAPRLIAAGPLEGDNDEAWTRRFIESMLGAGRYSEMPYGYSIHSYFWRRDASSFTPEGWYTLLAKPRQLAAMLQRQAVLLRAARTPITLVLDEWGAWYLGETGQTDPSHLYEQIPTLRDALLTALMFDCFHAQADILGITTVAQTVNCIHSLFITQGDRCVRTPVYHAFALYQPHIGGTAVRTVAAAERITFTTDDKQPEPGWLDGVSASATLHQKLGSGAGRVVLTVTNPRLDQPVTATVALRGVTVRSGDVTTLTHSDMRARNTVAEPDMVQLGPTTALSLPADGASGTFTVTLPPASTTRVICVLG